MKNVKIIITLVISAVLLTMLFQNCSSPFEASIESYNKDSQGSNLLPTDSSDSDSSSNNNGFQFPDNSSSSVGSGTGVGSNNTALPISTDCGNTAGVSISKFKTSVTGNYYNATETGTVAPGTVMSFPFVIDLTEYPRGIKFIFESGFSSGSYNRKDLSISKCPGQFEGLSSSCVQKNRIAGGLSTDPVKETGTLCKVEPGIIYYFNIRPTFASDETAAILNPRMR